jgi:hypothetical protein
VTLGKPQVLFDASKYYFGGVGRNYDVTSDGKRFIMIKEPLPTGGNITTPWIVVLNWAERLKK